jgi:hypothetical protein
MHLTLEVDDAVRMVDCLNGCGERLSAIIFDRISDINRHEPFGCSTEETKCK